MLALVKVGKDPWNEGKCEKEGGVVNAEACLDLQHGGEAVGRSGELEVRKIDEDGGDGREVKEGILNGLAVHVGLGVCDGRVEEG